MPPIDTDRIAMLDLRLQYQSLKDDIRKALDETLENANFIMGPNVHALEEEIAGYLRVPHALGCASGTDALHLALRALNIGPGDEVITPAFTFAASAEAIRYVNATPVFVDIDPKSFNIATEQIEQAISARTKAIIVVHLFGLPADLGAIQSLAEDKNIFIVEDCAQSFGASYKNQKTGSIGDVGCFSFFPSKNLGGCGDGGMICTHSDELAAQIALLRNHGSPRRYEHSIIGYNSRLDEMQAAILRIKLKHIERYNRQRYRNASRYTAALSALDVQTPEESPHSTHVYHQYTILSAQRDKIIAALDEENIASAIYYPKGLHRQSAFCDSRQAARPVTEQVSARCLSLPMYPELSGAQIERIAGVIERVAG